MDDYSIKRSNRKKIYESILVSVFINTPAINIVVASAIPRFSNGIMSILYFSLFFLMVLNFIISYKDRWRIENISSMMILCLIVFAYLMTALMIGAQLSIFYLVIYVLLPLIIVSKMDLDGRCIVNCCILIPLIGIPFIPLVFESVDNSISMGLSYAFLPSIVFSTSYLIAYSKNSTVITIAAVMDLIYCILILLHGSRGVVLSCFITIIVFWLIRKKIKKKCDKYLWIKVILLMILLTLLFVYRWHIIEYVYDYFFKRGVTIEFFEKMLRLQEVGGIDNGRNAITEVFLEKFIEKPLIGHGIKSFQYYTGIVYPHNFIFQILFDLGLIGLLVIMIPIVLATIRLVKNMYTYENAFLLIALICIAIPGALFSMDLWLNPILWLTFSLLLRIEYRT